MKLQMQVRYNIKKFDYINELPEPILNDMSIIVQYCETA